MLFRSHWDNYIHAGVPMVLSSDDPTMFGYSGLTYDFWEAAVSWGLGLHALKRLVYNSIVYSCLDPAEVVIALQILDARWAQWVDSMISPISQPASRVRGRLNSQRCW